MERILRYLRDPATRDEVVRNLRANLRIFQETRARSQTEDLTRMLYNLMVSEWVGENQYLPLGETSAQTLWDTYRTLVERLGTSEGIPDPKVVESWVAAHRQTLIRVLEEALEAEPSETAPCAEYTGEFQFQLLRLELVPLEGPILDVGCGRNLGLVRHLRSLGHPRVLGLDQFLSTDPQVVCSPWLEFNFTPGFWGTIVSHMAFTNHFRRALASGSVQGTRYAQVYFQILGALKPGGVFAYAPRVPNVEAQIDREWFEVRTFSNGDEDLATVHVVARDPGPFEGRTAYSQTTIFE